MYAASESTECRQRYVARQCSGRRPSHWKHNSQSLPRYSNACSSPNLSPETVTPSHLQEPQQNQVVYVNSMNNSLGVGEKDLLTAYLLCIFFGWLGGHRFYLDQFNMGLLYVFTFWFSRIWYIDRPHLTPRIGSYSESTFTHHLVKRYHL